MDLAIEDASGRRTSLAYFPEDAEQLVREARASVERFNASLGSGSPVSTARPSCETCRHCDFRVICEPYWGFLDTDCGHRDIFGMILSVHNAATATSIKVAVESPNDLKHQICSVTALLCAPASDPKYFAITDARGRADLLSLRAIWSSTIRYW